jgi:hypothetical protein
MFKNFFATALIITSFGLTSAQAQVDEPDELDNMLVEPQTSMSESSTSQASSVDTDIVKCWGFDGSQGGTDIRKMTRAACEEAHGSSPLTTAPEQAPVVKKVVKKKHRKAA